MHLHLLIPGLLELPAAELRLPSLSLMLGRGHLTWAPGISLDSWLASGFGLEAGAAPYAALRLLGENGLEPGESTWFCADPVQLKFTTQGLMLADASTRDLSMEEAQALVASLKIGRASCRERVS
jgi:hypothetical protein